MSDLIDRLRRAEWYCNRSEECMGTCDQRHARRNLPDPDTCHAAADALEAAEAKLATIDALHQTWDERRCIHCVQSWPCPTHRILHPEEGNRQEAQQ